ncbi:glutamine amidotransferase, partial [Salmonella enterica subsp. enterica serovar Virginia]|nr:glutamine amidotransferase [Salmonella enterica subsp. enterica serovar Virginia]
MNNTQKKLKVLFIGESWHIHMIHSKGYDSFTSSKYADADCLPPAGENVIAADIVGGRLRDARFELRRALRDGVGGCP